MKQNIVLLGVGMVGRAVYDAVRGDAHVVGVTRQPDRLFEFVHAGIDPIVMPWPSAEVIAPVVEGADVLVSFPPDGSTDAVLASACKNARSIVYISSTGVYGAHTGKVDDSTRVAAHDPQTLTRLQAEEIWREVGATVLRAPAIYGPTSGLHIRLRKGDYKIPGDGSGMVSRVHVEDLAQFILHAFDKRRQRETYVVGDLQPASHKEIVEWLCEKMDVPVPPYAPLDGVSPHMRASREVDSTRAREELGVSLKYPTYKEGFTALLDQP
jgi:nucleoside-diphosphate-sugar epimerase